ncbi:MAG: hypothetical protein M3066_03005 [Actinomycetota bacterium]|nr:hypothetical protein [Actinomycetota bacterium]
MAADGLLAATVFALGILSDRIYYDIGTVSPHNFRYATAVVFMAVLTLPLVFRRRLAPATLVGATLAVLGYTVFGITEAAVTATMAFVAIYSVGAYCRPSVANWLRAVCIAVLFGDLVWTLLFRQLDLGHSKASAVGAGILSVGSNLFCFIVAWAIGDVARNARLRSAELGVRSMEVKAAHHVIAEQAVLDERYGSPARPTTSSPTMSASWGCRRARPGGSCPDPRTRQPRCCPGSRRRAGSRWWSSSSCWDFCGARPAPPVSPTSTAARRWRRGCPACPAWTRWCRNSTRPVSA